MLKLICLVQLQFELFIISFIALFSIHFSPHLTHTNEYWFFLCLKYLFHLSFTSLIPLLPLFSSPDNIIIYYHHQWTTTSPIWTSWGSATPTSHRSATPVCADTKASRRWWTWLALLVVWPLAYQPAPSCSIPPTVPNPVTLSRMGWHYAFPCHRAQ